MLTKEQEQAVRHVEGPMMVVAGPGSGKTMVLTRRVQQLLAYTKPDRILVITFARKAAQEMQKRFAALAGEEAAKQVCFGTFHAVFYRWLREWKVLTQEHQILEEETQRQLWLELGWDMEDVPAFLLCHRDAAMLYEAEKRKRHLVDFDDLLSLTEQEISHHCVQDQYDFVLIDEFQDINPQQYAIVKQMVASESPNLFVVGDEDQAIYAFRGSDPGIFLHFPIDFPGCKRIDLTVNFRCQARIVQGAKELIQENQYRFHKEIRASKPAMGRIALHTAFDDRTEAVLIRNQVLKHRRKECPYEEMAILCRTRAQMKRIGAALQEGGIPYECKESWELIGKPEELLIRQDLEQFWRLSRNQTDRNAFQGLLRCLPVLQQAGNWHRVEEGKPILQTLLQEQSMAPEVRREVMELSRRLEIGGRLPKKKAFWYWLWQTDYLSYAYQKAKRRGLHRWDVWRQLKQMADNWNGEEKGVILSTMHGAKGLEFDWVWVAGLVQGKCPRKEAMEAGSLEEERRLFYVAMTRARKELHLSYYDGLGVKASQFLREIKSLHFSL